jgi:circadian clock protein KaiC
MLFGRAAALGMDLQPHVERGRVVVQQVDPAELSPGEFSHLVRRSVDGGARVVLIDSLNGFISAMPEERFVLLQLHELLTFLGQRGVFTLLTVAQHGLVTGDAAAPVDVSYLADAVLLFRYFEAHGQVRKAVSAVKSRSGPHEKTIRELLMTGSGIRVGPVLSEFRGVFTGVPEWSGDGAEQLLGES